MPEFVYVLCAVASIHSAVLLLRSYLRTRSRLLLWSSSCFIGLALNNVLLLVDLIVVPDIDLRAVRSASGVAALVLILIGLVWESR